MYEEAALTEASLAGVPSLASLSMTSRRWVVARAYGRRYPAGETIVLAGDHDRDVYFVASGSVRILSWSAGGRAVIFRDMAAGCSFGELAAIDGERRSADVHAIEDTFAIVLGHDDYRGLLARETALVLDLVQRLASRVRDLSARFVELSTLDVPTRVRIELLRCARRDPTHPDGGYLEPVPTHQEIANRIGTHREAVSRTLAALVREGLLARQGARLVIPDLVRLGASPSP